MGTNHPLLVRDNECIGKIKEIRHSFIVFSLFILPNLEYTKLLQKSEMRKDIVIELSYKGFSCASDYS